MEELLQQLVENELLTEETKKELTEAVNKQIEEAKEAAAEAKAQQVEAQIKVELQEQYQADKEALIEALDTKCEQYLREELEELRDDIENFRDLEVEFAEKQKEYEEQLSEVLKGDIEQLVETVDSYLDMVLDEEIKELKEDIEAVKKLQFGAEIVEAFENIYAKKFIDENGLENELKEREERLNDLSEQLEETTKELETVQREKKMDEVLSSLHGKSKDVMEAVLRNVPTNKLEEAYEHYIPKVLHENAQGADVESEKEDDDKSSVLAEGESESKKDITDGTVVATGNADVIEESQNNEDDLPDNVKETISRIRHLGGIYS